MWAVTRAWAPPFPYRVGDIPARDVYPRANFQVFDPIQTEIERDKARRLTPAVYAQNEAPLEQLRAKLQNTLANAVAAESLNAFGLEEWKDFYAFDNESSAPSKDELAAQFDRFKQALMEENERRAVNETIARVFEPLEQNGLLGDLPPPNTNQEKVQIHPKGKPGFELEVPVRDILLSRIDDSLKSQLRKEFGSVEVADRVFDWMRDDLNPTLELQKAETQAAQQAAADAVPRQLKSYLTRRDDVAQEGPHVLAEAGLPINQETLDLLRAEHNEVLSQRTFRQALFRSLAILGMFVAMYILCGFYIYRREPEIINDLSRFVSLITSVVVTVALCTFMSGDPWRAEMIALLLFGMTLSIAYHQELALLISSAVILVVVLSLGHTIVEFVILTGAVAVAVLLLRSVRTRIKLLNVGVLAGAAAALTTLGIGTIEGRPLYVGPIGNFDGLAWDAIRYGLWGVIAGSLMTCLLPFIEKIFDVQTDISLIELGDPAHPLLQQLVQRAPGTYNHSITVASLGEAAADAIGARGLLVRVGAYFHDIGKMLKPGYFIENQSQGDNRHESLVPAMSTLVIIAHVKDGADLARQHHLPDAIIDFIQQHHGTTLVEYFYRRASEQKQEDPDGGEVDETAFRYPGPKPQTKEAAVMMLADAVESASRVLTEPTPQRIAGLVDDLAMKRLMDGQYDECGLTLQELHTVQQSLVKSLTAVYHGRVKYPEKQRTA